MPELVCSYQLLLPMLFLFFFGMTKPDSILCGFSYSAVSPNFPPSWFVLVLTALLTTLSFTFEIFLFSLLSSLTVVGDRCSVHLPADTDEYGGFSNLNLSNKLSIIERFAFPCLHVNV